MKLLTLTTFAMSLSLAACKAPSTAPTAAVRAVPKTKNALVLRTDFSNEAAWRSVRAAIEQSPGDFRADVSFVSDRQYAGITAEQLASRHTKNAERSFAFIIDHIAVSHPEHPVAVVDLSDSPGRMFRVVPSEVASVENNLSLANMDFADFLKAAGQDEIFRGFPNE
jgi:hypothetical protein